MGIVVTPRGPRWAPRDGLPRPRALLELREQRGLTARKVEYLHGVARAALDGRLAAALLRALPAEEALAALRELPGIGPFSADLILLRGAGHPDRFPTAEARLHAAMADAYCITGETIRTRRVRPSQPLLA